MQSSISLKNWVFIYRDEKLANDLFKALRIVCRPMGMEVNNPKWIQINSYRGVDFINALKPYGGSQLIMFLMPTDRAELYGHVKHFICKTLGVPSQFALERTVKNEKRLMSVATKIGIQVNCKLGGVPWSISIPFKDAMVIGYDAYHDSKSKGDSFGATISSYNSTFTQYFGQASRHRSFAELSDSFLSKARNALDKYKQVNNAAPKILIVYRDGVGDGQLGYVKNHEIVEIKKCFNPKETKLLFIVVSKRINTRFFEVSSGNPNEPINPKPGSVVDDIVTLKERYDFYLISQDSRIGTVSPTSYNVIEDTIGWNPDHVQKLTYWLTHLYFNWQGTVRVPAPCLYAHKLAYICGTAVHDTAHHSLADKLW